MKIKTKLTLGVGLLFLLILILSLVGSFNINALKNDTENILSENYNSLQYCRNMLSAIEYANIGDIDFFESNLKKQESNITEIGEADITEELRANFEQSKENIENGFFSVPVRNNLYQIIDMNMQAIQRKSEVAKLTADSAVSWIVVSGVVFFLIAFVLLVNLPSNIANPIKKLTESIGQIADKNYSERVLIDNESEFGQLAKSFNVMAEKLQEYNSSSLAKLMTEKKRVETLIDKMQDPVIGLDDEMRVIFANEEANSVLGMSDAELIGFDSKDLALRNDLLRELIRDVEEVESSSIQPKPMKIYANEKECYFVKDIQPIALVADGNVAPKIIGHVILLRNVTEYKELDFAKTNFIANVSHEFKTPISSIKVGLQLMNNEKVGNLNEEQKQLLDSINDDADRLLKITGELLNMTQLESGNIQLSMLPADPNEILNYAVDATKTQAESKQIKFEIDCPKTISEVQADHEKTAWVLTNLISNAVRYSYDNSIIFVTIQEAEDKVLILVKDTGQGISPQYKDKIFDRYFRVPGTTKEGTGLGLAISKEFMEAQGGSISVESEFGAGSTFTLSLNKIVTV